MTRRLVEPRIVVATHNRGKLEEIAALLRDYPVEIVSAADLGLPEPEETETTFLGNARIKAHAAARASGLPALADDSGIEIDGLGGAPGVYTADWAATPTGRNFVQAMTRAWTELEAANAPYPRTARFRCTLVLAWPDGDEAAFEGKIEGACVWPMRGEQGHGYDPMFRPQGSALTLGEMDRWAKNRISHRGDAFAKFVAACLA
jgi:XTP/dITP diphosphohydrolase